MTLSGLVGGGHHGHLRDPEHLVRAVDTDDRGPAVGAVVDDLDPLALESADGDIHEVAGVELTDEQSEFLELLGRGLTGAVEGRGVDQDATIVVIGVDAFKALDNEGGAVVLEKVVSGAAEGVGALEAERGVGDGRGAGIYSLRAITVVGLCDGGDGKKADGKKNRQRGNPQ